MIRVQGRRNALGDLQSEIKSLFLRSYPEGSGNRLDGRLQRPGYLLEIDVSVGEFGIIEYVVDDGQQQVPARINHLDRLGQVGIQSILILHYQFGYTKDTVERGPDLVTHHGKMS